MQWALKNQGTRRNLTDEEIKKCEREALMRLGRRYNAEKTDKKKTLKRGNSPKPHVEGTGRATAAKVAKEEGVSRATVERAGARMEIHDAVEESTPRPAHPATIQLPLRTIAYWRLIAAVRASASFPLPTLPNVPTGDPGVTQLTI